MSSILKTRQAKVERKQNLSGKVKQAAKKRWNENLSSGSNTSTSNILRKTQTDISYINCANNFSQRYSVNSFNKKISINNFYSYKIFRHFKFKFFI